MWLLDAPAVTGVERRLRRALESRRFAVIVEVVSPSGTEPLETALRPSLELARALDAESRVSALSVTDRVRSDEDHDPVRVAALLAREAGTMPLVHLAGKDRTIEDLSRHLDMLDAAGLDAMLCVTGDRLKSTAPERPVAYVDSVDAVALARRRLPSALIAAPVSPFKYTEEATFGQYFKMRKKHAAGADCLITQVGWDMDKPVELLAYRRRVGFCQPVLVSCMALSAPMARALHAGRVPGIVVTGDLLALAEREATAPDRGRAAQIERLALQIVGVERLGFAGVQLSGLLKADDVRRLLDRVDTWRQQLATVEAWRLTWDERLRLPSGRVARTAPEQGFGVFDPFVVSASPADPWDRRRYRVLESIHRLVFTPRSPVARLLRPVARRIRPESRIARWLARLEHRIKGPLVDCRLCGYCRLPATFYICPESCPKGLANGPCGGSTGNACEADDRTCVHARVYRLAKAAGCLDRLERTIVPAAPRQPGGSSWLEFFAGRMPESFEG